MESIFDRITVSSAQDTFNQQVKQTSTAANNNATTVAVGSTGLIASVEAAQFERLVSDAVDPVVLKTAAPGTNGGGPKRLTRYVFSCAGIVFVTQCAGALRFGSGVREVECLGVLCDGKPIGRGETNNL